VNIRVNPYVRTLLELTHTTHTEEFSSGRTAGRRRKRAGVIGEVVP